MLHMMILLLKWSLSDMLKRKEYKIYLLIFVDKFNPDKIKECLNYEGSIGHCSFLYKPEYEYNFQELFTYLQNLEDTDIKYPWKLHDIMLSDYPLEESIDVVLDTNKKKNETTHYAVFENINAISQEYFASIDEILENCNKHDFGAIAPKGKEYNGFLTSFSNFMIYNKNNQINLLDKLKETNRDIFTL